MIFEAGGIRKCTTMDLEGFVARFSGLCYSGGYCTKMTAVPPGISYSKPADAVLPMIPACTRVRSKV